MPKKSIPITDIKGPKEVKPSTSGRPIVVTDRPTMANDPMMVSDEAAEKTENQPQTAPVISHTAKTLQPASINADEKPKAAEEETAVEPEEASEPIVDSADDAADEKAEDTVAEEAPHNEEATTASADNSADAATQAAPSAPDSDTQDVADDDVQTKPSAKEEAEAAKAEAAARAHEADMQKLIESRQFNVPINAIEQKRSIHHSIWLTVVVIILAIVLVDFMLDANVIALLTKLPHTHFFSPNPHF